MRLLEAYEELSAALLDIKLLLENVAAKEVENHIMKAEKEAL